MGTKSRSAPAYVPVRFKEEGSGVGVGRDIVDETYRDEPRYGE